jgi:L-alanine-DL-glutamate epimerase-like enolase superfamily enzyme
VDVLQPDIISTGFSAGAALARQLDQWQVRFAPHHYGAGYGNYASCHLAAASSTFVMAEWDETAITGLAAPGYSIRDGRASVPAAPGFGLILDDAVFARAVANGGFLLTE